jgi:hypothetical protein
VTLPSLSGSTASGRADVDARLPSEPPSELRADSSRPTTATAGGRTTRTPARSCRQRRLNRSRLPDGSGAHLDTVISRERALDSAAVLFQSLLARCASCAVFSRTLRGQPTNAESDRDSVAAAAAAASSSPTDRPAGQPRDVAAYTDSKSLETANARLSGSTAPWATRRGAIRDGGRLGIGGRGRRRGWQRWLRRPRVEDKLTAPPPPPHTTVWRPSDAESRVFSSTTVLGWRSAVARSSSCGCWRAAEWFFASASLRLQRRFEQRL